MKKTHSTLLTAILLGAFTFAHADNAVSKEKAKAQNENTQQVSLQMGSFTDAKYAEERRARLNLIGVQAKVEQAKKGQNNVLRVVSKRKISKAEANKLLNRLERNEIEAFVIQ